MSIKRKFVQSAFWMIAGTSFSQIFAFLIFVVLSRLLTPNEFGIVAFATIFIELSRPIVTAGVPDALIRHKTWDQSLASTGFWLNLGMSLAICLLCILAGVPLLGLSHYAGIGPVFAALAATLVVDSPRSVLEAKLRRDFAYRILISRSAIASAVGGVTGVTLAFLGWGVWALVASSVTNSILYGALIWYHVRWLPSLAFSRGHALYLGRFSSGLVGAQLLAGFNGQVAGLVIGVALGPAPLALYRAGNRLLSLVTALAIMPLQKVALTAFASVQDKTSIPNIYLRLTSACALVACPIFIGAGAIAQDLTVLCLGRKWMDSGPVMTWGAFVVGAAVLNYFFTPSLTAAGNTRYSFVYYASAVTGNALFAFFAAPFGVVAVMASQTLRAYVGLPFPLMLLKRGIGLSPIAAVSGVAPAFLCSLAMGGILILLRAYWLQDFTLLGRILVLVPVGAALYVLFMLLFGRPSLAANYGELRPLLPNSLRVNLPL
jgi:O-antigen/teichoic acid export membrane protein